MHVYLPHLFDDGLTQFKRQLALKIESFVNTIRVKEFELKTAIMATTVCCP
jgi:hypothetical protein